MGEKTLKTVDRALKILEKIRSEEKVGVSELARDMGMSKSSVYTYLQTLEERGFIFQNETGEYLIDLKFIPYAGAARKNQTIYRSVETLLTEIAEETGESVSFAVEFRGSIYFVEIIRPVEGVQTNANIGFNVPIYSCPEGRYTLAHLSEMRRSQIIHNVQFPIDDVGYQEDLLKELDDLRKKEVVTEHGSLVDNVSFVFSPVIDGNGSFHGIVAIAGPSIEFDQERIEELSKILRKKLGKFNINFSYE